MGRLIYFIFDKKTGDGEYRFMDADGRIWFIDEKESLIMWNLAHELQPPWAVWFPVAMPQLPTAGKTLKELESHLRNGGTVKRPCGAIFPEYGHEWLGFEDATASDWEIYIEPEREPYKPLPGGRSLTNIFCEEIEKIPSVLLGSNNPTLAKLLRKKC